eukprot:1194303-Prorocentrum_minimum.AAC.5
MKIDEGLEQKDQSASTEDECCDWELLSTCSKSSGKHSVHTLNSSAGESMGHTPGSTPSGKRDVGLVCTCFPPLVVTPLHAHSWLMRETMYIFLRCRPLGKVWAGVLSVFSSAIL